MMSSSSARITTNVLRRKMSQELPRTSRTLRPYELHFRLCHQSLERFELWQSAAQSTMKDENTLSEQGWLIRKQKVHTFFVFVCFVFWQRCNVAKGDIFC